MTKVNYVIVRDEKETNTTFATLDEVKKMVKILNDEAKNHHYTYKTIYAKFNPEDTFEVRKNMAEHVKKIEENKALI